MAGLFGEVAHLAAQLDLTGNFNRNLTTATRGLGKFDAKLNQSQSLGYKFGAGIGKTIQNLAKLGAAATVGIGLAVHAGIDSLATLEDATTSVDAAIKQTGQTGKVTSQQIAGWANEIESNVQAAFDDKDITKAAATLIRFGKVTTKNLKPALVVMTDLATKTGSVDSAAALLAKALADPEKAAGKLARTGVILTKAQQAQIKAFVKAGQVGKAQKVILDSLAKTTKGAAAASAGPYRDALNTLRDVTEDAERALAIGFLPVLQKVAGILKTELAKPATIQALKDFGTGLAGTLDQLINVATKLPWDAIGNGLKIAGAGAKAVLDAFTALPDWVQTAVITGWGLNKLSGGIFGDVVGQLASGLIKGVLGMNAGVVNINAGVVNGGGIGGAGGAAAGFAGAGLMTAIGAVLIPAVLAAVQTQVIQPGLQNSANNNASATSDVVGRGNRAEISAALHSLNTLPDRLDPLQTALYNLNANGVKVHTEVLKRELAGALIDTNTGRADHTPGVSFKRTTDAVDARGDRKLDSIAKTKDIAEFQAAAVSSVDATKSAVDAAKSGISGAIYTGTANVAAAVRNNPPPIVNVNVSVTPSQIQKTTTIVQRYGPSNGSAGSGNGANPDREPRD